MPVFSSFDEAWRWFEDNAGAVTVSDEAWAASWARGRAQYLALLARVEEPAVVAAIERMQRRLSEVVGVAPFSADYLHVTLVELGFQAVRKTRPDELTPQEAAAIGQHVAPLFQRSPSVRLSLGPPNVLNEAIVCELRDDGQWKALRHAIEASLGRDPAAVLPHVSVAHCVARPDGEALLAALQELRASHEPVPFTVRRIELVRAWLIGGFPLEEPDLETVRMYGLPG